MISIANRWREQIIYEKPQFGQTFHITGWLPIFYTSWEEKHLENCINSSSTGREVPNKFREGKVGHNAQIIILT